MNDTNIWVLGGYQSDFARNLTREGGDFASLTAEVIDGTLVSAGIAPREIEVLHVGNAFGELFAGQGQLGAMPATVRDEFWGLPASRHEAVSYTHLDVYKRQACSSGNSAKAGKPMRIDWQAGGGCEPTPPALLPPQPWPRPPLPRLPPFPSPAAASRGRARSSGPG